MTTNPVEEYAYQVAAAKAEVIDKSFHAILATKRPRLYAVLKVIPSPWLFKLFGFRLRIQQQSFGPQKYQVLEFDEVLGAFIVEMNIEP